MGNVMTVLYADAPGLQVPDPTKTALTPEQIRDHGLPGVASATIGPSAPPAGIGSSWSWVDVNGFWESGNLLVSFGEGWFCRKELREALPEMVCPVLHRVVAKQGYPSR